MPGRPQAGQRIVRVASARNWSQVARLSSASAPGFTPFARIRQGRQTVASHSPQRPPSIVPAASAPQIGHSAMELTPGGRSDSSGSGSTSGGCTGGSIGLATGREIGFATGGFAGRRRTREVGFAIGGFFGLSAIGFTTGGGVGAPDPGEPMG